MTIGEGVNIGNGCIICHGVIIGNNTNIEPHTIISLSEQPDAESDDDFDELEYTEKDMRREEEQAEAENMEGK